MKCLIIDTCTERGLIAAYDGDQPLFIRHLPIGLDQSKFLMTELASILPKELSFDLIAPCVGPGSYTGIRVGVAVAKALAYSWKLPLLGISSLDGYVLAGKEPFAAILDAKIGGAYVKKQDGVPEICPLDQLKDYLGDIRNLVTPQAKNLKIKLEQLYPGRYLWHELPPSAVALKQRIDTLCQQGIPHKPLEMMYLREWKPG